MPKYNEEDCTGCMLFLLNLEVRDVNQSYNEKWNVLVPNNEYDQNIVVFDSIYTVPMKDCSKISYLKKNISKGIRSVSSFNDQNILQ